MFLTSKQGKDLTIDVSKYINILHDMLDINGTVVFNHLGSNIYTYPAYKNLSDIFPYNLFMVDIASENSILYASRGHVPAHISADTLHDYENEYLIPFRQLFYKLNRV